MIQARGRQWRTGFFCWTRGLGFAVLSVAVAVTRLTTALAAGDANVSSAIASDSRELPRRSSFDGFVGTPSEAATMHDLSVLEEGVSSDGFVVTEGGCGPACECGLRCDDGCPDPAGLIQRLHAHHAETGACWIARGDALLLWRDSPGYRPLVETADGLATPVLNSNQLESTATGGVRGSIMRVNGCSGDAWEGTYIYAGNFTAQRLLPYQDAFAYEIAPPGIYGNELLTFDAAKTTLLAKLQSAECNRHVAFGPNVRWLTGFRWVQWEEQFTLESSSLGGVNDLYQTGCINNLYGGQIGLDAHLLSLTWLRVDSLVKAGAYYNNAVQSSRYTTNDSTNPGSAAVTVGQSPASAAFVGEVGLTGVIPLSCCVDFRFGYFGLWLTGLAQPTQQLAGQQLTPGETAVGSIDANGGTLVQGLSLGLEGRW